MASISPFFEAFLDGFTGGGVFVKLRQPGAPTQVFADEEGFTKTPPPVKPSIVSTSSQ